MSDRTNPNDYADPFRPRVVRTKEELEIAEREFREQMDERIEIESVTDNVLDWEKLKDEPPF